MTDDRDVTVPKQPPVSPHVSHCILRGDGTELSSHDADRPCYAASTVKLAVLAALGREVAAGTIRLDEQIGAKHVFASKVPGAPDFRLVPDDVDRGLPPEGTPMSIGEVARRMIVVSSNECTNMLVERLGIELIGAVIADAGAEGVRMGRGFGDVAAVRAFGVANHVTARGLARLMAALITGRLCEDDRVNAWMTDLLQAQASPVLAADLPAGVRWGSKDGYVTGIRHDVAWFGAPGPEALVVAVCTEGVDHDAANQAIATIGRIAHDLAGESHAWTP